VLEPMQCGQGQLKAVAVVKCTTAQVNRLCIINYRVNEHLKKDVRRAHVSGQSGDYGGKLPPALSPTTDRRDPYAPNAAA
jgi:hypothetical protein